MNPPELILHIGAPKCGSSALQTALSAAPDLTSADGTLYKYTTVATKSARLLSPMIGADVTAKAAASRYGYASWPSVAGETAQGSVFEALNTCRKMGARKGFIPIASNESWINHPEVFADYLKSQGNPRVDVVAFLRAPVDWVNAAFWQWGIWVTPNLDVWLDRAGMSYDFAEKLKAWREIPNVQLFVRRPQPDVVVKFSEIFGIDVPPVGLNNAASSAALIGFLLRNRKFRVDGHDASTEFVVQRWCDMQGLRKPWAVAAHHVHRLRDVTAQTLETLQGFLPPHELNDLFIDRKWRSEAAYHGAILAGASPVDDTHESAILLSAIQAGARKAWQVAGKAPAKSTAPATPSQGDEIAVWDTAITYALDDLLSADWAVRSKAQLPYAKSVLKRLWSWS